MTDVAPLSVGMMGVVVHDRCAEAAWYRHRRKTGAVAVKERGAVAIQLAQFDKSDVEFRAYLCRIDWVNCCESHFFVNSNR